MGGLLGHNYSTAQSGKKKRQILGISGVCHISFLFIMKLNAVVAVVQHLPRLPINLFVSLQGPHTMIPFVQMIMNSVGIARLWNT